MMLDFILLYRRVHRSTLQVSNEVMNKSDQLYLFVTVLEKVENIPPIDYEQLIMRVKKQN